MRQQLVDVSGFVRWQSCEHVFEVGVGNVSVELGRLNQARDTGSALAGQQGSGEEPVFSSCGQGVPPAAWQGAYELKNNPVQERKTSGKAGQHKIKSRNTYPRSRSPECRSRCRNQRSRSPEYAPRGRLQRNSTYGGTNAAF